MITELIFSTAVVMAANIGNLPDHLPDHLLEELASMISTHSMETIAVRYFGFSVTDIHNKRYENFGDAQRFNSAILKTYADRTHHCSTVIVFIAWS